MVGSRHAEALPDVAAFDVDVEACAAGEGHVVHAACGGQRGLDEESGTVRAETDLPAGGVAAQLDGAAVFRRNDLRFAVGEACDGFRAVHRKAFIQFVGFEPMEAAELHGGFEGEMPCDAVGVRGFDGHGGIKFSDVFHDSVVY